MIKLGKAFFVGFVVILISCNSGPKEIKAVDNTGSNDRVTSSTGIFSNSDDGVKRGIAEKRQTNNHRVTVKEVLPTSKYVYMNVEEDGESFWLATLKQDVEVGEQYIFKDGLLKTNFESKEYNRVFDKVYLVSTITKVGGESSRGKASSDLTKKVNKGNKTLQNISVEGSISIAELIKNKNDFAGKSVILSGVCMKVNPNIMGRNWVHLVDGTMDEYDLVLTTNLKISEGMPVALKGVVSLDKDFGAGYKYDIIIENAELAL